MSRKIALVAALIEVAACSSPAPSPSPAPLAVTKVTPSAAPALQTVFINGTGFQPGVQVTLDGAATNVQLFGTTEIRAVSPRHGAGQVDVVVINSDGARAVLVRGFTYTLLPPPTVAAIATTSGLTSGGGDIRFSGTGFQAGATVGFDGRPAILQFDASPTLITVSAPAHSAGPVDVVITNPDGQSTALQHAFTYVAPAFSDFNGDWVGSDGIETEGDFLSFTIRDNLLRSVACRGTEVVFATPPSTSEGTFTAVVDGAVVMTGGLISRDSATGTINIGACANKGWFARR